MKIVLIISANAEWRILKEIISDLPVLESPFGDYAQSKYGNYDMVFFQGGWGKISASASTQYVIDHFHPDLIVNLGTCGGFAGRIQIGTTILVEKTIVYDIIEQMEDAAQAIDYYTTTLDLSWLPADDPYPVLHGLLISADRDILAGDIPLLIARFGAVAADWESGAIAWVAKQNGTRLLILRAVTDLVDNEGGETYGNVELFHHRTKIEMRKLLTQLPGWLTQVGLLD